MKSYLVLFLLLGLIPQAKASVRYIPNSGRIKIEVRCQDGLAEHHISYMDERGKTKILELQGNGDEYLLFNLEEDSLQQNNLAQSNPEKLKELKTEFSNLRGKNANYTQIDLK